MGVHFCPKDPQNNNLLKFWSFPWHGASVLCLVPFGLYKWGRAKSSPWNKFRIMLPYDYNFVILVIEHACMIFATTCIAKISNFRGTSVYWPLSWSSQAPTLIDIHVNVHTPIRETEACSYHSYFYCYATIWPLISSSDMLFLFTPVYLGHVLGNSIEDKLSKRYKVWKYNNQFLVHTSTWVGPRLFIIPEVIAPASRDLD